MRYISTQKRRSRVLSGLAQGAENAEPEPKPLGRPGLGYFSAITVGLINPPT